MARRFVSTDEYQHRFENEIGVAELFSVDLRVDLEHQGEEGLELNITLEVRDPAGLDRKFHVRHEPISVLNRDGVTP